MPEIISTVPKSRRNTSLAAVEPEVPVGAGGELVAIFVDGEVEKGELFVDGGLGDDGGLGQQLLDSLITFLNS